MEKTLRKACRYGDWAKFWRFLANIGEKLYNFSQKKWEKNRKTQLIILKSVGFDSIEEYEEKMVEATKD